MIVYTLKKASLCAQRCSEMVMPISAGNDTMFPPDTFDFRSFRNYCNQLYGVAPRPHWVTTYYGGDVCTSTNNSQTILYCFIETNKIIANMAFISSLFLVSIQIAGHKTHPSEIWQQHHFLQWTQRSL